MRLIEPSVEIWEQGNTLQDIWTHIARCTRVCYQSTPKNDGETDEEFVKRVILRQDSSTGRLNFDKIHGAMLEHGTIYLKRNVDYSDTYYNIFETFYETNAYSKVTYDDGVCHITTNLRVLYENNCLDDLKYICAPTENHAKRVTASFITNIGVTREFNRHRVNSMAEESTRYCNYSLGKFDNEVTFVKAAWCPDYDETDWDPYIKALCDAEKAYFALIKKGWKPQQAREVLPLATKTQLIHTAFVDDWKHFFALRADGISGPAHPNAKLIAAPLKEEFIKRGYI